MGSLDTGWEGRWEGEEGGRKVGGRKGKEEGENGEEGKEEGGKGGRKGWWPDMEQVKALTSVLNGLAITWPKTYKPPCGMRCRSEC